MTVTGWIALAVYVPFMTLYVWDQIAFRLGVERQFAAYEARIAKLEAR